MNKWFHLKGNLILSNTILKNPRNGTTKYMFFQELMELSIILKSIQIQSCLPWSAWSSSISKYFSSTGATYSTFSMVQAVFWQLIYQYFTWKDTPWAEKWCHKLLCHFFDIAVVQSWLLYRRDLKFLSIPEIEWMPLRSFKMSIANSLLIKDKSQRERTPGQPSTSRLEKYLSAKKKKTWSSCPDPK